MTPQEEEMYEQNYLKRFRERRNFFYKIKVIGLLLNNFVESYNQQEQIETKMITQKKFKVFKAWLEQSKLSK